MTKEITYRQVRLKRGTTEQVCWVEERGAHLGKFIEVLDDEDGRWEVIDVYTGSLSKSVLLEKQRMDRASLYSIK